VIIVNKLSYTPTIEPFPWYKKINPLWWGGNANDGIRPVDYMPTSPAWWATICWFFRNPFHNLTFYVIGVCDRPSITYGSEPGNVFSASGSGWLWTVTVVYGWLPLPFVSHIGKTWKIYAGWRSLGGSFGLKFQRNRG
jgi:hypothetical protein